MRGDEFFVQISRKPPFTKLHPRVAEFFKGYFAKEKVIQFGGQHVVNTKFPPYLSSYAYLEGADAFGCGAGRG